MPSKSVTISDDQYRYIIETQGDDSFSERLREVLDAGVQAERDADEYACDGCGTTFGNAGAKVTHERTCPELQE